MKNYTRKSPPIPSRPIAMIERNLNYWKTEIAERLTKLADAKQEASKLAMELRRAKRGGK